MAASISSGALQQHNPTFQSTAVFNILDPISLILSQNSSDSFEPIPLKLTTEAYFMEQGPRYSTYAHLRESKLRTKTTSSTTATAATAMATFSRFPELTTPPKKQLKFKYQPHNLPAPVS
ncbi:unnamed protein product [Linum trigynum]|uniref:Uncharacterized protein n=1 Tax=Linum trigynum TaxID=586398 RepID=A0AAV2FTL2_9ROSI